MLHVVNVIVFPLLLLLQFSVIVITADRKWDHQIDLDENYRLLWTVREPEIIFEVQVRTRGYVGFGFSRDGTIYGADLFISWIDQGHQFFHVSTVFVIRSWDNAA